MFFYFKILAWCLGMRYADEGSEKSPWIFGIIIGAIFGFSDVIFGGVAFLEGLTLFGCYIFAACIFTNLRYRFDGIFAALLLAFIGAAVMFFGIPFFVDRLFPEPAN